LYPDQLAGIQLKVTKPTQTHGTMKSCPALDKELCIFYDGTTTPCNMFNPYVYGNIFKQSLEEMNFPPNFDQKLPEIKVRY
jgi:MoaA/NifB/PqqE/SkfB family radical SAM enzyme